MTSEESRNVEIVELAFDRWARGEATIFEILAEDISWTVAGSSPISGTYEGYDSFVEGALAPLAARLATPITPTLRETIASGDTVVVLWDGVATANDGSKYANSYVWVLRFDQGVVVRGLAHFDGIELADLFERVAPS